jgi:hypothetical protein
MARKFLYAFAIMIALAIAIGIGLSLYSEQLTSWAMVPTVKFEEQPDLVENIYSDHDMWYADKAKQIDWRPEGAPKSKAPGNAAIFFIHPTSYIGNSHWNAALDDQESSTRARIFLRGLATPFGDAGEIWAPKYRQAAIGAFLTQQPNAKRAIDTAYRDVLLAFDRFVSEQPKNKPIIIAGHSQGALHLTYLLCDRVAGKPLAKRIVAAYVVGWPVSVEGDLPQMGLPSCSSPEMTGCIMSWQSFAEPADYGQIIRAFNATLGLNSIPRKGTHILCTNPLNGGSGEVAGASANLGTLKPNGDLTQGKLIAGSIPARCDKNGFLLIGNPPDMGPYRLPGNNYHVYDYPLFWSNVRADALRRLAQFETK